MDVGGTKVFGAIVDASGQILEQAEESTDPNVPSLAVGEVIDILIKSSPIPVEAIGLAVAGFVQKTTGRIVFAPNLRNMDADLAGSMSRKFAIPVVAENDANAAAWAEWRFGAGRGVQTMVMLTVGTGIGGGAILDGRLYRGSRGFACEFGHIVSDVNGHLCGCGRRGCLEAVASGTALARMAREQAGANMGSRVVDLAGGRTDEITGAMVGEAARMADPFALSLFSELGYLLGLGLAGLSYAFDPELIVIGGGVGEVGEPLIKPASDALAARFQDPVPPPRVVSAILGNHAGAIGAACLAARPTVNAARPGSPGPGVSEA